MYTLRAVSREDFRRDVLKSDTAQLELPELELVLEMGTLGSMYTTVEGLLNKVLLKIMFCLSYFCHLCCTKHRNDAGVVVLGERSVVMEGKASVSQV